MSLLHEDDINDLKISFIKNKNNPGIYIENAVGIDAA